MDVRNCPRCGDIYLYVGFNLCESCRKGEEQDYMKVKDFLKENPGTTVNTIAEKTGVGRQQILNFIKAGRLKGIVETLADAPLKCERCEKPIFEGRLCTKCQVELAQRFRKSSPQQEKDRQREDSKIRFLKRDKR